MALRSQRAAPALWPSLGLTAETRPDTSVEPAASGGLRAPARPQANRLCGLPTSSRRSREGPPYAHLPAPSPCRAARPDPASLPHRLPSQRTLHPGGEPPGSPGPRPGLPLAVGAAATETVCYALGDSDIVVLFVGAALRSPASRHGSKGGLCPDSAVPVELRRSRMTASAPAAESRSPLHPRLPMPLRGRRRRAPRRRHRWLRLRLHPRRRSPPRHPRPLRLPRKSSGITSSTDKPRDPSRNRPCALPSNPCRLTPKSGIRAYPGGRPPPRPA
jgi:hypothetical protein